MMMKTYREYADLIRGVLSVRFMPLALLLLVHSSCSTGIKCGRISGHEYVDLGLPSKTVWATCNVGAQCAEEYGNFYAWGETKGTENGKENFSWDTYSLPNDTVVLDVTSRSGYRGDASRQIFHCLTGRYRNVSSLLPEDDAATVNWGEGWTTPSLEQWNELRDTSLCLWKQEKNGYRITSKINARSIFLPSCGVYAGDDVPKTFHINGDSIRYEGFYWSATQSLQNQKNQNNIPLAAVSCLSFHVGYQQKGVPDIALIEPCFGMSIRPVATLTK